MNFLAIGAAAAVQFIIGAIWYMPLFGKLWGKIHGFETHSPEVQKEMQQKMMPLLLVQFLMTIVTTVVLSILITDLSIGWNAYLLAGVLWLGFVVPTQVSAVLFGGTNPKWVITKILVMAGGALACLEAAAAILSAMQ